MFVGCRVPFAESRMATANSPFNETNGTDYKAVDSSNDPEKHGEDDAAPYSIRDLPGSVYFIVANELCERFSYYGLRAILVKYFIDRLDYSERTAKSIFAYTTALAYFMPILGGVVSDSWLGKFKTIFIFSLVYVAGGGLLAGTAIDPAAWGAFLALFLISVGTGGIKPCVSAFGADQLPQDQPKALSTFFHMFYFSINLGSVCSILIVPVVRSEYGYAVAFSIPAVLLLIATSIFLLGKNSYQHNPPTGSVLVRFVSTLCAARTERKAAELEQNAFLAPGAQASDNYDANGMRVNSHNDVAQPQQPTHWIDYACRVYPAQDVDDAKRVWAILPIFCALPIFWTLFDQQGSTWTLQAEKLDPMIGSLKLQAEQIQALNAFFILALVPLFDRCVYPSLQRCGFSTAPLKRMVVGMIFGALAFFIAGGLDLWIANSSEQSVNVGWQAPQYLILSIGEVLVSTTGLEFAYSQAPQSMKSTVSSLFLLTTAVGDLLAGVIFSGVDISPYQMSFLCAGLMVLNVFFFAYVAHNYAPPPPLVISKPDIEQPTQLDDPNNQVSI